MIFRAEKFESLLRANGAGAFGKVEYDEQGHVILRTNEVKTADMSGTVRLYFNNQREQLMTGRRFDPMGSGLILLRPGVFYRVYTTIEIEEPLPRGVSALVVLRNDVSDVLAVTTGPFREGYTGPVAFTVQPYRKVEIEKMTTLASLMFFVDLDVEAYVESAMDALDDRIAEAVKKANSVRTKKSTTPAKKKTTTTSKAKKTEEKADEGSAPDKRADDTKG